MEILKRVLKYKKSLLVAVIALLIIVCGIWYFNSKAKPELKAKEFESAVNENISKKADTYLSNSKKDSEV